MNELCKRIIAHHDMLDAIRIRKNTEAPVEALKEDLRIPRTAADLAYKKLRDEDSGDALITKNGRQTKILGEKGYFLGISIGSQHTRVVLLDLNFDCVPRETLEQRHPTLYDLTRISGYLDDASGESDPSGYAYQPAKHYGTKFESIRKVVSSIVRLFLDLAKADPAGFPLLGIGFAVAGPVDYEKGIWLSTPHIVPEIQNITLSDILGHELLHDMENMGLFLSMDNNAKTSIISEYQYLLETHSGQYSDDIALIYLGSGIGSSAVLGRTLLRGSQNLSGELGQIRLNTDSADTFESLLEKSKNYQRYIPLVLNTINCILGIDRFILVGHNVRNNRSLIPSLMDQRIQFTVPSTQQYCKAEIGRGTASTAAIGAAMEAYFTMCNYDFTEENGKRMNLAEKISWPIITE